LHGENEVSHCYETEKEREAMVGIGNAKRKKR